MEERGGKDRAGGTHMRLMQHDSVADRYRHACIDQTLYNVTDRCIQQAQVHT